MSAVRGDGLNRVGNILCVFNALVAVFVLVASLLNKISETGVWMGVSVECGLTTALLVVAWEATR